MLSLFLKKLDQDIWDAKQYAEKIKEVSKSTYLLAQSYIAEKENDLNEAFKKAKDAYKAAQEEFPGEKKITTEITIEAATTKHIAVIERLADISYRTEKTRTALDMYDMLITLGYDSTENIIRFIYLLMARDFMPSAQKFANMLIEKVPKITKNILRTYTYACAKAGCSDQSRVVLEDMLEKTGDPDVAYELGEVYLYSIGKLDKDKIMKVINTLDKTKEPNHFELKGQLFIRIDMPKDAVVQLLRGATIAYDRDNKPKSQFTQSQRMFAKATEILIELGEKEKARAIIKRAENLIPTFDKQYGKMLKMRYGKII